MTPTLIDQLKLAIQVESGEVDQMEVQYRSKGHEEWMSPDSPSPKGWAWRFESYEYRRKPKPLELWFVFYDDRSAMSYESSDMARNAFDREKNSIIPPTKIVHMREVTND